LFKNKKKEKHLKTFTRKDRALATYNRLVDRSNKVKFPVKFVNRVDTEFEIALLCKNAEYGDIIYVRDEMGRQVKKTVGDEDFDIIKIKPYKIEEEIFDRQTGRKITIDFFIKKYMNAKGMKVLSKLNNKLIYEIDGKYQLFVLKTPDEASRFMDTLWDLLNEKSRNDIMMFKDFADSQRDEMYKKMGEKGFDIEYLKRTTVR
jgi:hypothetical protein